MHQLRRHLHAAHGLNVWYATAMGLCGCLGLLLLGFISYWCFMLRQDSRRRRSVVLLSNSYESSHLLQRASLDWPSSMTTSSMMTLPLSSSSTSLYLSPIPEELRSMCSEDVRDEFDDFNRDKEFVQDFCDQSEYVRLSIHSISIPRLHTYLLHHRDYVWLDKPALYMGKNRSKRMYLLGRATSSLAQLTSRGRLGGGGESKHVLCSLFPTTAAAMQAEDLSALRAFFHYVQEQCPHVLPVLGIHLVPSTDKVMVLTPYVPQGSLKDYIYHRCKTAVVQVHDVFGAIFQSTASTGPPPTIESLLSLPLFRKHALQRGNRPTFARRDQMLKTVDGVVGKQLPRDAVARSRSQDGALPIVLQVA
ncbi:hypothetical protein DYB31_008422 [Aphanomyces astaci]|uniref:Uncharacterized protein n=1 Tax=Aphanomyces astaci TaxID=112090 RepID=A0A397EII0_APHAT|nr:hypothetical protein DYB31_008422 [Aphanomyces astaci]